MLVTNQAFLNHFPPLPILCSYPGKAWRQIIKEQIDVFICIFFFGGAGVGVWRFVLEICNIRILRKYTFSICSAITLAISQNSRSFITFNLASDWFSSAQTVIEYHNIRVYNNNNNPFVKKRKNLQRCLTYWVDCKPNEIGHRIDVDFLFISLDKDHEILIFNFCSILTCSFIWSV